MLCCFIIRTYWFFKVKVNIFKIVLFLASPPLMFLLNIRVGFFLISLLQFHDLFFLISYKLRKFMGDSNTFSKFTWEKKQHSVVASRCPSQLKWGNFVNGKLAGWKIPLIFLWLHKLNLSIVYIPHLLNPVICWWALRWLPCFGYFK